MRVLSIIIIELYSKLVNTINGAESDIEKDVKRTFPDTTYFKEPYETGNNKLYNILKAYSQYDTKVGYCQGMNYIAGILMICLKDEKDAYLCLLYIMYKFNWRRIYMSDMKELLILIDVLVNRIKDEVPSVYDHFIKYEVSQYSK